MSVRRFISLLGAIATMGMLAASDVLCTQEKTGLEHAIGIEVPSLAFSPDGKTLATAAGDSVLLRGVNTGKELASLAHDGNVYAVAFSPDNRILATAGSGFVQLWDVETRHSGFEAVLPHYIRCLHV